jgi:hypothetical protein
VSREGLRPRTGQVKVELDMIGQDRAGQDMAGRAVQ